MVKVIEVHQREYTIAAFVDDILLFLSSLLTSLPNIMPVLEKCKAILNLKINYSKSFALIISLPHTIVQLCQNNFPFRWKADGLTYLDIQLPSKLKDLYKKKLLIRIENYTAGSQKMGSPHHLMVWPGLNS